MTDFLKPGKQVIVETLNNINGMSVSPNAVNMIVNPNSNPVKVTATGDNVTAFGKSVIPTVRRNLNRLFADTAVVIDTRTLSGEDVVTAREILPLVSEQYGIPLSENQFYPEDLDVVYLANSPESGFMGQKLIFRAKGDSLDWEGNFQVLATDFSNQYQTNVNIGKYPPAEVETTPTGFVINPDLGSFFIHAINTQETSALTLAPSKTNWVVYATLGRVDATGLRFPDNLNWVEGKAPELPFWGGSISFMFFTLDDGLTWSGLMVERSDTGDELLSRFLRTAQGFNRVNNVVNGHRWFLNNNTGDTENSEEDFYVLNWEGVLANNRHFTYRTMQAGQPNCDATTEGQSLLILGWIYEYLWSGNQESLQSAKYAFDAYVSAFYMGLEPPNPPARWVCNWIVNGKEPQLANWPYNATAPTHSGFLGELLSYVNGRTQIPRGAPLWGEYVDKVTMAFDGAMAWQSIVAEIKAIKPNGDTDWNTKGTVYAIDWAVCWDGHKYSGEGDDLGVVDGSLIGTIQLKDTTVQGEHKTCWCNRQPVEYGGVIIDRNAPQHNRPCHVPVERAFMGNAADAEQWFCDAAYYLWKITGESRYEDAFKASMFTIMEYTNIDALDKFFRQSTKALTPFTDGIAYDFTYPSGTSVHYGRDSNGYITAKLPIAAQLSLEQQAIWFRGGNESSILTTYGGLDDSGEAINVEMMIHLSKDKSDANPRPWGLVLPPTTSEIQAVEVPMTSLTPFTKEDGTDYVLANIKDLTVWGGAAANTVYEEGVNGDRYAPLVKVTIPNDAAQFAIGLYRYSETRKIPFESITCRCSHDFNVRIEDDLGWRWWWMLSKSSGVWRTVTIVKSEAHWSGYQPKLNAIEEAERVRLDTLARQDDNNFIWTTDEDGNPVKTNDLKADVLATIEAGAVAARDAAEANRPPEPQFTTLDELTILLDDSYTDAVFSYYAINDIPPTYSEGDGYTLLYRLTFTGENPYTVSVGDCTMLNYRRDSLAYTPGIIPFSNNYLADAEQFDGWHGMPYPGYQHPFFYAYVDLPESDRKTMIDNTVNFLWDSQQWYTERFGIVGPGASAYVWNRWDNLKYGPADTFTMYHWGDGHAWAGYQPRAFFSAVRLWEALEERGLAVPDKLKEYVKNWITFLVTFMGDTGITPTDFPMTTVPGFVENDFTGHMSGLWLAGTSLAYILGVRVVGMEDYIEKNFDELRDNYINRTGTGDIMNGGWSPWADPDNNGRSGMYFGFWSGEILRGLSLYAMYRRYRYEGNYSPLDVG